MPDRHLWILKWKGAPGRRKHMGLFSPDAAFADKHPLDKTIAVEGTLIQAAGEPFWSGFQHEFRYHYRSSHSAMLSKAVHVGAIDEQFIEDQAGEETIIKTGRSLAHGERKLDGLAERIPMPPKQTMESVRKNPEILKDCQDWTLEFVKFLVGEKILDAAAIQVVIDNMDQQTGVGLRPVSNQSKAPGSASASSLSQR